MAKQGVPRSTALQRKIRDRVVALIDGSGKTNAELGRSLGIDPSTVSRIRDRLRFPTEDHLLAISKYFDVSMDYLYTGDAGASAEVERAGLDMRLLVRIMEEMGLTAIDAVEMLIREWKRGAPKADPVLRRKPKPKPPAIDDSEESSESSN